MVVAGARVRCSCWTQRTTVFACSASTVRRRWAERRARMTPLVGWRGGRRGWRRGWGGGCNYARQKIDIANWIKMGKGAPPDRHARVWRWRARPRKWASSGFATHARSGWKLASGRPLELACRRRREKLALTRVLKDRSAASERRTHEGQAAAHDHIHVSRAAAPGGPGGAPRRSRRG